MGSQMHRAGPTSRRVLPACEYDRRVRQDLVRIYDSHISLADCVISDQSLLTIPRTNLTIGQRAFS